MARGAGLAWKSVSLFLRLIQLCCAIVILGIFSYFLAKLASNHVHIDTYLRAVEGISGAAVLYTLFALSLVCCLGGIVIFSILGMVLDLAFAGAFAYVAYATRHGANSCSGFVRTPFGNGVVGTDSTVDSDFPSLRTSCKLQTATFAVSIVAIFFFLVSAFVEVALMRQHKKEKAFGPSPNNGYTAGTPRRKFWQRKPKNRDLELAEKPDTLPAHQTPADMRTSYATDATAVGHEPVVNKYGHANMTGAGSVPQSTGTTNGYQTTTTTHSGGGYTPYRSENGTF